MFYIYKYGFVLVGRYRIMKLMGKGLTIKILFFTTVVLSVVAIVMGIFIYNNLNSSNITHESKTTTIGLKNIGELATQSAYVTEINVTKEELKFFNTDITLSQSHYVYSYDYIIKAGFKVEDIIPEINEETKQITIVLPQPEILSVDQVLDSFKVYIEKESIFRQIKLEENNKVLINMEEQAKNNAINNGLFEAAKNNAKNILTSFFSSNFDATEYEYIFEFK